MKACQYTAVKNAMENQISVIQGPPGTGKTQTILNIIANILMQDKTVQIALQASLPVFFPLFPHSVYRSGTQSV